ncbi:DUF2335 domain-containing protein [Marinomonas sp. M1K-6]|uniref:DUF2335 domain-containing protein n=1 Tax=Marinomonas profundi TaxID=2726122 RepID=A0A847QZC2_9GAMM|nr:DUF2335 domain-containing protein [Marinomonas profundi]NLQ16185.1 DUF2335 domain-containing protein [Marinomonas profundi]UDV03233.1 DUF2335 domain-containing protein [Marinomonas profundi]
MNDRQEAQEDSQIVDQEIEEIKENEPLSIVMEDIPDVERVVRENPEERRKVMMAVRSERHSGPFPPPEHLEQYEKVHPGFTKDSFAMMRENAEREERIIAKAQDNEYKESNWNRSAAMAVVLLVLLAIVYLADQGNVAVPIALSGVLVALAIAFLLGQKNRAFDPNASKSDKGKIKEDTEE